MFVCLFVCLFVYSDSSSSTTFCVTK